MKLFRHQVLHFGFATILALLVSALSPHGFMPEQTEAGFAIKLCSGHTDNELAIKPDHPDYAALSLIYGPQDEPAPDGEQETKAPACSFSIGASLGLVSADPVIEINALAAAAHESLEPRRFALRSRINIPPATGPPVTI